MEIIGVIVAGIIIGLVGNLVALSTRNNLPLWLTIICGLGGAIIGWFSYYSRFVNHTSGIDWIRWLITVVAAGILMVIANVIVARRSANGYAAKGSALSKWINLPLWLTIICCLSGTVIGEFSYASRFVNHTSGIDWIRWLITVVAVAILLVIANAIVARVEPGAIQPAVKTPDPVLDPGGMTRVQLPPRIPDQERERGATRTIVIFLASSSELRKDRDAFELRMLRLNSRLPRDRGIYLKIERWEHFLDAMSQTRLQDEYNKAIRECDVFVSLFFTKTGKYTEQEFTTAHDHFKRTGRPFIYTYFKNASITTGKVREEDLKSLWKFKRRLGDLGHFPTYYDNIDELHGKFIEQIEELLDGGL
jgi:hypothetical protein